MTEEEILSAAGRIRASKRRRVVKPCERCGKEFEGLTQAKYCSDACRVAASRARTIAELEPAENPIWLVRSLPGESTREYWVRIGGELTPENEEWIAEFEEMRARRVKPKTDSTELIRRMREEPGRFLKEL
jgi:hypothetical protein